MCKCANYTLNLHPNRQDPQKESRTGRSCIQQIHILRRIMDGAYNLDQPLFITFIDFKKAFDSIDRSMMFAILRHYGIPEKIVAAIRVLYDESFSQVYVQRQLLDQRQRWINREGHHVENCTCMGCFRQAQDQPS